MVDDDFFQQAGRGAVANVQTIGMHVWYLTSGDVDVVATWVLDCLIRPTTASQVLQSFAVALPDGGMGGVPSCLEPGRGYSLCGVT